MQRKSKYIIIITALAWMFGALFIACGGLHWLVGRENAQVPKTICAAKSAKELQKDVEAKQKQAKEAEAEKKQLEKEIAELESQKKDAASYISVLDEKLTKLTDKMDANREKITRTKKEIKKLRKELEAAKEEKDNQYDTMKKRIKYMYENGNQVYIEILFGAKSIPDLLNRSEYVSKITDYDKTIFQKYQEITLEVQKKEQQHQAKVKELEDLKTQKKEEKQAVKELKADKKRELEKYNQKIEKSQDKIDEYTKKAIAAENEVEKLLQQKQEEIEREMAAGGGNSGGNEGGLEWPLRGGAGRLSSGFGPRHSPTAGASSYHKGIDLAIASGTPILAVGSGKVVTASYSSSAGNYVMISHGNRLYSVYMHCSRLAVKVGDKVSKGQVIA